MHAFLNYVTDDYHEKNVQWLSLFVSQYQHLFAESEHFFKNINFELITSETATGGRRSLAQDDQIFFSAHLPPLGWCFRSKFKLFKNISLKIILFS